MARPKAIITVLRTSGSRNGSRSRQGIMEGNMAVSWNGLSTRMCRYHVPSESQKKGASHDRTLTVMWQLTGCHYLVCATARPVLTTSPVSQNIKEAQHQCFNVACCCCSGAGEVGNCSVVFVGWQLIARGGHVCSRLRTREIICFVGQAGVTRAGVFQLNLSVYPTL